MEIYLLDKNEDMIKAWQKCFEGTGVKIVQSDFEDFMKNYDVECVVSPGNSFGLMTGGYDLAISNFFGEKLAKNVQKYIMDEFNGEQPVGTAFLIDILRTNKKLIHCPSMRLPEPIKDVMVIYFCMRESLKVAKKNKVESIVIPAFGCGCGKVDKYVCASLMRLAFDEMEKKTKKIDWIYANRLNTKIAEICDKIGQKWLFGSLFLFRMLF